ncbi:MAG: hypothetical protein J7M21_00975 [Planctomycetes bacterium]|nr:hypothetical protein [Planctomycetota bacterium]
MAEDEDIPDFCDFSCPYSEFPPADSAGLCRTMAAVYCTRLGRLVDKNRPCPLKNTATKPRRRKRRGR